MATQTSDTTCSMLLVYWGGGQPVPGTAALARRRHSAPNTAHRAAEKIALRNVRVALDGLATEDNQQRNANRVVLVLVVAALLLGTLGLWRLLQHKPQEIKILIPLSGAKK